MLRWDSRRASTATVLKRKSKANTEKGNPGKSSLSIYGILLKMTKGTNVKSVWNQNERKQLILTDDHNTFSTTNWVDLTLNRWGQKRTHAKIHPDYQDSSQLNHPAGPKYLRPIPPSNVASFRISWFPAVPGFWDLVTRVAGSFVEANAFFFCSQLKYSKWGI